MSRESEMTDASLSGGGERDSTNKWYKKYVYSFENDFANSASEVTIHRYFPTVS